MEEGFTLRYVVDSTETRTNSEEFYQFLGEISLDLEISVRYVCPYSFDEVFGHEDSGSASSQDAKQSPKGLDMSKIVASYFHGHIIHRSTMIGKAIL